MDTSASVGDLKSQAAKKDHAKVNTLVVVYRSLCPSDRDEFKELHEEWFPIRYSDMFYDNAVHGRWMDTNKSIFAVVASLQGESQSISNRESSNHEFIPVSRGILSSLVSSHDTLELSVDTKNVSSIQGRQKVEMSIPAAQAAGDESSRRHGIIGLVTAQFIPENQVEDKGLIHDTLQHSELMYILTLGAREQYRRQGIATSLVQRCIDEAKRNLSCGAIFLHVKADNAQGRKFYEKNGFVSMRRIRDYYMIDNKNYDAYLYAFYVNGARTPDGWVDYIARPWAVLFSLASLAVSRLFGFASKDNIQEENEMDQVCEAV